MKIIYLSRATIPSRTANSIQVMKMCQAFSKLGHDVYLVAPDRRDNLEIGVTNIYQFYNVDECFKIIKKPWIRIKGRGYFYGYVAGRFAKIMDPDLVYCRTITGCFFAAKNKLPIIFESHSPHDHSKPVFKWMFNTIIKSHQMKQLIVITGALKNYYQKCFPSISSKIRVLPDGADPLPDNVTPKILPFPEMKFHVGYVGHLYKGKGMEIILQLAQNCPWAAFHIVGGKDKDIDYWEKLCHQYKNIIFHGFIQQNHIPGYLKAFDAVLLPNQKEVSSNTGRGSNIAQWTSPLKAFEYMAAGKAIVCSDLPVLREIFISGRNGLLCSPDNVLEWVDALKKLKKSPQFIHCLGEQAKQDFLEKFTWRSRAMAILQNNHRSQKYAFPPA
jgi:glycosyltransferase involved in cell wall biosynthesis